MLMSLALEPIYAGRLKPFKVGWLSRPTFLGKNVHAFRNFCRKSMGKPIFVLAINLYAMQTLRICGDIVYPHFNLL